MNFKATRSFKPFTFKCFEDEEEDKAIIKALSSCSNKTAFIKDCIKKVINNDNIILTKMANIEEKLDILISKPSVYEEKITENIVSNDPATTIAPKIKGEKEVTSNNTKNSIGTIHSEDLPSITRADTPITDYYESSNQLENNSEEEMKQNVLNCMSRFLNM